MTAVPFSDPDRRAAQQEAWDDRPVRVDAAASRRARTAGWLGALVAVRAAALHRWLGPVGADGLVLVPSRSVPDGHHEVRVEDGAAVGCSCWPARRGRPCAHRAAVAVALWEAEVPGARLEDVASGALLPVLLGRYLEPPRPAGGWRSNAFARPGGRPDGLPERRIPE